MREIQNSLLVYSQYPLYILLHLNALTVSGQKCEDRRFPFRPDLRTSLLARSQIHGEFDLVTLWLVGAVLLVYCLPVV